MELVQRTFTYTHFQNVNVNLSADTINYVLNIKQQSGFTSYDEATINYNDITNALYNKFPPNQFTTSPGDSLSAYTIVTCVEPHQIMIGEYILLKPLFGDDNLLGLNLVNDVGDRLGANPDFNVLIYKPYTATTIGLVITQINEVLSFFKGFNIQPTYDSINTYFPFVETYFNSPDVKSVSSVGVGDFIRVTPRRLFNELGFEVTNESGGTENTVINLPIYLTQTLENIGLYELPYSSVTDTKSCDVLSMPDSYYKKYNITTMPDIISGPSNTFTYILIDGITANTYSDFYEPFATFVSGTTSEKSLKVRKYAGDGIRYGYQLPSLIPNTFKYTLQRNTTINVNDGYIEYSSTSPLSASTRSQFRYNSWGRSPQNAITGNDTRMFVSMVHDELNDQLILEPKIKNDVFIDRGVFSPFERVYKLGYMRSLEDITSFERGEFNVVEGTPIERQYLTNG